MNQAFSAQGPVPVWAQAAYAATSSTSNITSQLTVPTTAAGLPAAKKALWFALGLVAGLPGVLAGSLCFKGAARECREALTFSLIGMALSLVVLGIVAALIAGGVHDLAATTAQASAGVKVASVHDLADVANTTYSYTSYPAGATGGAA